MIGDQRERSQRSFRITGAARSPRTPTHSSRARCVLTASASHPTGDERQITLTGRPMRNQVLRSGTAAKFSVSEITQ